MILIYVGIAVLVAFLFFYLLAANYTQSTSNARALSIITQGLNDFLSRSPIDTDTPEQHLRAYQKLRLGEVTRHFDNDTLGSISGWMTHNLAFRGWGVAGRIGKTGVGVGSLGLSGTSQVSLELSAVSRDDLMSNGFIAVLEEDSPTGIDTLRIVVPSERAAREWVQTLLEGLLTRFDAVRGRGLEEVKGAHPDLTQAREYLTRSLPRLLNWEYEAAYVSDRLNAILRQPVDVRPQITVVGQSISRHAILPASIRFGVEDTTHLLFPIGLVQSIPEIVERAVEAGTPPTPTTL